LIDLAKLAFPAGFDALKFAKQQAAASLAKTPPVVIEEVEEHKDYTIVRKKNLKEVLIDLGSLKLPKGNFRVSATFNLVYESAATWGSARADILINGVSVHDENHGRYSFPAGTLKSLPIDIETFVRSDGSHNLSFALTQASDGGTSCTVSDETITVQALP
jgi:archaellum component FlaF (FlaF/FlaG flagellin family)